MSGPFLGIDIGSLGAAGVPLSFRADLAPVAAAWTHAVWDDSAFRGRGRDRRRPSGCEGWGAMSAPPDLPALRVGPYPIHARNGARTIRGAEGGHREP